MHILKNTGPTSLTQKWYEDGTQVDAGTVTIGIVDSTGTEVVASGTATTKSGSGATTAYAYSLAIQTAVKRLTVTWTRGDTGASVSSELEVVGAFLFSEVDLRAYSDAQLTSASTFTDAAIVAARSRITDEFEHICGVSFVPRFRQQVTAGYGDYALDLDRPQVSEVLSASIGGVTVAASNFVIDNEARSLYRTNGYFTSSSTSNPLNVTVTYEHGYATPPADISRAAIILARHQLLRDVTGTGVPANASSWTDSSGSYTAFAPNNNSGRFYGFGEVDTVLQRYMSRSVLI